MREIVRGRLEGLGPTNAGALATSLGVDIADVDAALLALEAEGSAMRGNFEPDSGITGSVVRSPAARARSPLHSQASAR